MQRAILFGTILGAAVLGVGCESQLNPSGSKYPTPVYANVEPEGFTSMLTGYSVDAEAFWVNLATCGQTCPLPPIHADIIPLFTRSVVRNAPITVLDLTTNKLVGQPSPTTPAGMWTLKGIPSRDLADPKSAYLIRAQGGGTLANDAPSPLPLPPVPVGNYVPTVTYRPIMPSHSVCLGLEAAQVSDKGVLEAIAKFLSAEGSTPVTVSDLVNPTKYDGVTVIWMYHPGFTYLRAPGTDTTVEASKGRVLNLAWAPPDAPLPPEIKALQSTRGFFVTPGAPTSALGIVAVLHPKSTNTGEVTYTPKDEKTDAAEQRPWSYPPIKLTPVPGAVVFASVLFNLPNTVPPTIVTPSTCLPK